MYHISHWIRIFLRWIRPAIGCIYYINIRLPWSQRTDHCRCIAINNTLSLSLPVRGWVDGEKRRLRREHAASSGKADLLPYMHETPDFDLQATAGTSAVSGASSAATTTHPPPATATATVTYVSGAWLCVSALTNECGQQKQPFTCFKKMLIFLTFWFHHFIICCYFIIYLSKIKLLCKK